MINYNKNKLINKNLDKYYETFSHMLDTNDYVPEKFNDKIGKYIFKNMKKSFKKIDKEDKCFQKSLKKKEKLIKKETKKQEKMVKKPTKFKIFKKIGGFFYGLFHRKTKKDG